MAPVDLSPPSGADFGAQKRRPGCVPSLDECRSPFSESMVQLPSLAMRRPAPVITQGGEANIAWDATPTPGSRRSRRALEKSSSVPVLTDRFGDCTPGPPMEKGHQSRPRQQASPASCFAAGSRRTPGGFTTAGDSPFAGTPSTAAPASVSHVMEAPTPTSPTLERLASATPHSMAGLVSGLATPTPSSQAGVESLGWRRGDELGAGTYGRVYMAQDKADGHIFAVKVARIDEREESDRRYRDKLQHELEICKDLRHRHIVSCLGHAYAKRRLYIYLEYVPGGSLRRMLNSFGPLEIPLLQKATRGLLKGLNYLHTHNPPVVHRDLKGANVLVDLHFCMKLADFGCSKRDLSTMSLTTVGSLPWVAPEVLQQEGGHGRKADIWSLGCVVVEMATAEDPWGKGAFDNFMQAVNVVMRSDRTPPVPEGLPAAGVEFLGRCLRRAPEERPWASDLLDQALVQATPSRTGSRASRREG